MAALASKGPMSCRRRDTKKQGDVKGGHVKITSEAEFVIMADF
jgi:hypothetical protein